jgi:hypothetical protein
MGRDIPFPMPTAMRDTVNIKLGDREMSKLDSDARFIVRTLVAEAYARGFQDGRIDEHLSAAVERDIRASTEPEADR